MSKIIDVWVGRQLSPNPAMPVLYCTDMPEYITYYAVDGEVVEYMFGGPSIHWKQHTVDIGG